LNNIKEIANLQKYAIFIKRKNLADGLNYGLKSLIMGLGFRWVTGKWRENVSASIEEFLSGRLRL